MKKILHNTWSVLLPSERKKFGFLLLFDILISILDILSLALLLWIIQFYVTSVSIPAFLPRWLSDRNSVMTIAVFLVIFSIKNIGAYLVSRAQFNFSSEVAVRISRNNLVHYQRSDFSEFVEVDSSVQIRKIGFQPFEFCQYILTGIQQVMTQSSLILVAITAILIFNAKLFLMLLVLLLPPVVGVFLFIRKKLSAARSGIRTHNERSFQFLLDALKGYMEGNIYQRNSFFTGRFIRHRRIFSQLLFHSLALQTLPSRVIEIFAIVGLFILIALATWTGENTNAFVTLAAFMAAAYKIIPGSVKIINISGQMKAYEFSIGDLARNQDNVDDESGNIVPVNSLQLKSISFAYGKQNILNEFNLSAERGDFIGITGRSGRGKTTVFNLLLGFLQPCSGTMSINGKELDHKEIKDYRGSISYVRQQPFLIHDTILRNITLQDLAADEKQLEFAVAVSGLEPLISASGEGLDKMVSENGKNISGGQQQRITLARALYKNADVVLLDEPFNELDESSMIRLLQHFRTIADEGKIVIMITHDKKSLTYCNKIISLDDES